MVMQCVLWIGTFLRIAFFQDKVEGSICFPIEIGSTIYNIFWIENANSGFI